MPLGAGGQPDRLDLDVVLVGPEVRRPPRTATRSAGAASRLRRGVRALLGGVRPVLDRGSRSPSAIGCGQAATSPAAKTCSASRAASVASHTTPRLQRRAPSPTSHSVLGIAPSATTDHVGVDARAVGEPHRLEPPCPSKPSTPAAEPQVDAVRAVQLGAARAELRAERAASGCGATSISVTSSPSLRAVAATSQPMKPAPTIASRGLRLRTPRAARARRRRSRSVWTPSSPIGRRASAARARRSRRSAGRSASRSSPSTSSTPAARSRPVAGDAEPPLDVEDAVARQRALRRAPARRPAAPSTAAGACRAGAPRRRRRPRAPSWPALRTRLRGAQARQRGAGDDDGRGTALSPRRRIASIGQASAASCAFSRSDGSTSSFQRSTSSSPSSKIVRRDVDALAVALAQVHVDVDLGHVRLLSAMRSASSSGTASATCSVFADVAGWSPGARQVDVPFLDRVLQPPDPVDLDRDGVAGLHRARVRRASR